MIPFDPEALKAPLADLAEALRLDDAAPAVLVEAARGGVSARAAAGVSDLATGEPARVGQTFDIGSQTKMMTAVVILQLAEEGRLDLDARLADYLPDAVVAGLPNADQATLRQALSMTSGIPNYTDAVAPDGNALFARQLADNPEAGFGPEDSLEIARGMSASFAPGAAYEYSNTGFVLLGSIIEAITGGAIADAFESRIFAPLGMSATTARPFGSDDPRLRSYATLDGERVDVTDAPWMLRGEGGVISTTSDLIRFTQGLLQDGKLLTPGSLAQMLDFTEREASEEGGFDFGLGIAQFRLADGRTLIGFTGGTLGATSSTYLDSASGLVISIAETAPDAPSLPGVIALGAGLEQLPAWATGDFEASLRILSGSAAEAVLARGDDGLVLTLADASVELGRGYAHLSGADFDFADGSVLALGGRGGDRIDARGFAGAQAADNHIRGRGGDDRLDGAAGDDRIAGGAGDDRLHGRGGDDWLLGGAGDDVLAGGAGRDRLGGGAGDDALVGGAGRDLLRGGSGADHFVFLAASDSLAGHADVIRDFVAGEDRLDLRGLGAELTWIGSAAFGAADEVRLGDGGVEVDLDGDGAADFAVRLATNGFGADDLLL